MRCLRDNVGRDRDVGSLPIARRFRFLPDARNAHAARDEIPYRKGSPGIPRILLPAKSGHRRGSLRDLFPPDARSTAPDCGRHGQTARRSLQKTGRHSNQIRILTARLKIITLIVSPSFTNTSRVVAQTYRRWLYRNSCL